MLAFGQVVVLCLRTWDLQSPGMDFHDTYNAQTSKFPPFRSMHDPVGVLLNNTEN